MFTARRIFGFVSVGVSISIGSYYQFYCKPINKAKKYQKVVIFGAPGSGKGTQSELIIKNFGFTYVSSGDVFRSEIALGTPLGKEAQNYIDQGRLVPDNLVIGMIKNKLLTSQTKETGWLLDGMPRTEPQAKALSDMGCHPDLVIVLDVPDKVLEERICGRRVDPVTKKIYHMKYNPPPKEIESRLITRSDDTEDMLKTRLVSYHKHRDLITNYYGYNGDMILFIDGNRPVSEIYAEIHKKLTE
jgi:adenylate kinase